jgi:hypothetical protein
MPWCHASQVPKADLEDGGVAGVEALPAVQQCAGIVEIAILLLPHRPCQVQVPDGSHKQHISTFPATALGANLPTHNYTGSCSAGILLALQAPCRGDLHTTRFKRP